MTTCMTSSWRPERLFGMPAFAAAEGSLGQFGGAGVRGDILISDRSSSEKYQVKPAVQANHTNPVGASSS